MHRRGPHGVGGEGPAAHTNDRCGDEGATTSAPSEDFTIGVEEEYQILDPVTRELCQQVAQILPGARAHEGGIGPELQLSQIEAGTPVCATLADVRAELTGLRREIIREAARQGTRIGAAGTHPFSHWSQQAITPKARYLILAADYAQTAAEQMVFGCHVHIGISDREATIQTMNRVRPWLATILALGVNSPFWLGEDTGYASYRTDVCGRWPTAGTPSAYASRADYDKLIRVLEDTGSIRDESKIYWDVRPSASFETLEFRVTDVCLRVDEAVMIAGLVRALTRTCHEEAARDEPMAAVSPELLRAAKWRAARHGLEDTLIDIEYGRPLPAPELVGRLLDYVRPALEAYGDWDEVAATVEEVVAGGTGARRQRDAYRRAGRLEDVVDMIVEETSVGAARGARR